ncbi:MAG: GIY-YIG nuclease family protein [Porticoccaceae bacterium]|nr:GIY-YIG nuclease family protein [Porticoccaceae bacterium]
MTVDWSVYIIRASDCSLYTGISTDVERRFLQHQRGAGAKYFHAGRRPEQVVFREAGHDRSSASRREAAIKKLPRSEKLRMAETFTDMPSENSRVEK